MIQRGTQERDYLDQIIEAAQLGKNLVGQIKLFGSKKKKEYKPVVMGTVVQEALTFFKRTLSPNITFKQWITAKDSLVQADSTQIYQLILNLCTNAVQAMKPDKGFLEVSLRETRIGDPVSALISDIKPGCYLKLTVQDSGCGISPETRSQIFDPFFTTKKTSKGTGLGLAIVHEIIKNSGGSILIHSEVGKGTRFEIFLPLYVDTQGRPDMPEFRISGNGSEKHILLVDDTLVELKSIHQLLVHLGHRVDSTSDPQEALSIFRDGPDKFDMIITDQVMPRMKGHILASHIRKIREDIPIIICSGSEEALRELQEKMADISEFILKPFSRSQLAEAIDRVL
jgi:CheY-like chemotaxis protein/two-component sensor histidine kinase